MLDKTERPTATTPTEDLIPEAREHQRRRYLRAGLFAVICAVFIAVVIMAGVILF